MYEDNHLMCSANGCPNFWTVKMGKPLCSAHQWGDPSEWGVITSRFNAQKLATPQPKSIANYYEPPNGDPF